MSTITKEQWETLEKIIAKNQPMQLAFLEKIVSFPSVSTSGTAEHPYGEPCAQMMDYLKEYLEQMELATTNHAYRMLEGKYNPNQPDHLGILCHSDVVPADPKDWGSDPFQMRRENGKVFGRGVIDDKGPLSAVLFALQAIQEANITLDKNVTVYVGSNEENGSDDLEYFMERHTMPPYVFTPDGSYPVIYIEKGMLRLRFRKKTDDKILAFQAGTVPNAVPPYATVQTDVALTETDVLKKTGENTYVYTGVSAHASTPELGKNPITALLQILTETDAQGFGDCKALLERFPNGCTDGSGLGIAMTEAESGPLTCAFTMLEVKDGMFSGCFDIRFPICTNCGELLEKIYKAMAPFEVEVLIASEPHYTPKDSELVQKLCKVYAQQTGEQGDPIAIGGGTYVHDIPGGVAFGVEHEGIDYHMHGANEWISEEQLLADTKMMAAAILEICRE